jgi:integrase
MTVRRSKRNGAVRLIIDIPYKAPTGEVRRYRRDAQVQTVAAANAEDRRLLTELGATGEIAACIPRKRAAERPQVPTFADAVKAYRAIRAPALKPSTRNGYDEILKGQIEPLLADVELRSVDFVCSADLDARLSSKKVSASRRRNVQVTLRSVLRAAVDAELLATMPRLPPLPKVGRVVIEPFPRERIEELLARSGPSQRRAFAFAIYAGLRAGEVRGLRPEDVDLEHGTLIVRRTICNGVESPPKSGHERMIPIAGPLAKILESGFLEDGPAAPTKHGKQWGNTGLRLALRRMCKRIGIRPYRFHSLRHYFVTELFRLGVSAPTVRELAGHADLRTTQRYAHVVAADLRTAISTLGGNGVVTGRKRPRRAA